MLNNEILTPNEQMVHGESSRGHHLFLSGSRTQPTKVKVLGTFYVPSTWNPGKRLTANGTAERAGYFGPQAALTPPRVHL
jgi:hypothetical protein